MLKKLQKYLIKWTYINTAINKLQNRINKWTSILMIVIKLIAPPTCG